jgi:hypothetical protein
MSSVPEGLAVAYERATWQRSINPGRILFFAHSTYGTWQLSGVTLEAFVNALKTISNNGNGKLKGHASAPYLKLRASDSPNVIKIDFLTPKKFWLDACTITVTKNANNVLELHFYNQSTGVMPLMNPYATLLGCLFWFVPFTDAHQYCTKTMLFLKAEVDEALGVTSDMEAKRYIGQAEKL